jgi:hypothetical protein
MVRNDFLCGKYRTGNVIDLIGGIVNYKYFGMIKTFNDF